MKLLGLGTVAVDDLLHVAAYPPADGNVPVLRKGRHPGGQIGTALAAAARLGCAATYAGTLGDDELSRWLSGALEEAGIGTNHIVRRAAARPIHSVIIADEAQGTRTIFFDRANVEPFPLSAITPDLMRGVGALVVDQLGEEEALRAAWLARSLGISVVGDLAWTDRPRIRELMTAVDHLVLSQEFARSVSGCAEPEAMAQALQKGSPRPCTAVTCGEDGCYFLAGGKVRHQPAFRVAAVSTTGCGDVFHGAYAAALLEGQPVAAAIRFASAAAALYAARPNGWEHLPARREVEALLATTSDQP